MLFQKRASAFPTCLNGEGISEHTDGWGQPLDNWGCPRLSTHNQDVAHNKDSQTTSFGKVIYRYWPQNQGGEFKVWDNIYISAKKNKFAFAPSLRKIVVTLHYKYSEDKEKP